MRARPVGRWAVFVPLFASGWLATPVPAQSALAASTTRANTPSAARLHIEVSLDDRLLHVLSGTDTLRTARIAVASGRELRFGDQSWRFETPKGRHVVRGKRANPVWTPPDWHYAEEAQAQGLQLEALPQRGLQLADGRRVQLRGDRVSVQVDRRSDWVPLPEDEHLIFGSTLYIPPFGSRNRQVHGELGAYALDLGDGYLVHGTPHTESIGSAVTHGCLRLFDDDITWLFTHVPVGTRVLIR